jgi:CheY-like chemotaxis protein
MSVAKINVLIAVRLRAMAQYRKSLAAESKFNVNIVTNVEKLHEALVNKDKPTDVLVIDNALENTDTFELVREIRKTYARLLIILVDEDADFAMPGHADEVSTHPFEDDELSKIIKRLFESRRLETLRADSLPPVRHFAKALLKAKGPAKTQAAVSAIQELGYDYVAFFSIRPADPPVISLAAQAGPESVTRVAPTRQDYENSVVGWVAQKGQSRIVGPDDTPNHPFITKGRFGTAALIPVGTTLRFGVVMACREEPGSIDQKNVLMLELVSAQLASSLARDNK